MKTLLKAFLTIPLISFSGNLCAQDILNNIQLPELELNIQRKIIRVPELEGSITLKCDFHMHTVFSDGIVWPTTRVQEAWEEGLDAIAITDHIENNPSKPFVGGDDNSSYEIAKSAANDMNILLIKACEITRSMPPGHLNALFITDANKIDVKEPTEAIMEAHRQGAFIFWNHPGWKAQQPDTCMMFDVHKDLIQKKIIQGIEVFNEKEWYPIVLGWCINNNLAVIGNSDIHDINAHYYPLNIYHRPMTLVFANDRSYEGIKQALLERKTVAWFSKYVTGRESILQELFQKSISTDKLPLKDSKGNTMISVINNTDFIFEFKSETGLIQAFVLQPNSSVIVRFVEDPVKNPDNAMFSIENWFVDTNKNLKVMLRF